MNKDKLIKQLFVNHSLFVDYINSLTNEKFIAQFDQKWNAGKELDHIVKSVGPLAKVLGNKATIIENFGTMNRPILNYIDLTNKYRNELKKGGIALGKFIPEKEIGIDKRAELTKTLLDYVKMIENNIKNFTEDELDNLVLQHPLLGQLAIREMIYFTIYHVEHHKHNIKRNIKGIAATESI